MTKMSCLVVAIALWLISVSLLGPAAHALPNHVVTGGVFGPGGTVQPGPGNPANAGGAVFYSTQQPTYPVLVEPTLAPADGTLPASFATDVGASWNWAPGDDVVVIVETVRGVNLWGGVNYTTSVDGILQLSGALQDIGSGTLEALPPLTLRAGSDYVNVSWTTLVDANGNVASYTLFRGPPFTPVATVTHQASASRYFNNTGLTPGNYCYNLAVNYKRDTTGGTYTTLGRSETQCAQATGAPYIVSATPGVGATGVPRSDPIVITFNENMNQGTVGVSFLPTVTGVTYFWPLLNQVSVGHDIFAAGTLYQITVTGQDQSGTPLGPGPFPTSWTFTTNVPPTATFTAPTVGECRTGGSALTISWTMGDTETPSDLTFWLNWSDGVITNPIEGPTPGVAGSVSRTWTTPTGMDGGATFILEVIDGAGEKAQETSPSVEVDSTPPTVLNINPPGAAMNVPTDAVIWLNFSEAMNQASVQAAFSISPGVSGVMFQWTDADTLRVSFSSFFAVSTLYTVTVGTGAKDDCTPGLALASAYSSTFTTGQGPATLRPKPPSSLQITSTTSNAVGLSWVAPSEYEDGRLLSAGDIVGYDVYRSDSATGTRTKVGSDVQATTFTDGTVQPGATYFYWVKAKHRNGQESDFSLSASTTTPQPIGIDFVLLGLILLIIVLAIAGAALLVRRRKKPERPPSYASPGPVEELPSEETTEEQFPPEQGGGYR